MKLHPDITTDRVLHAVEESTFGLDNTGFCIKCGSEQEGCEPDARKIKCESCGERAVYGAQEIMFHAEAIC
jgi:hypothetical protein